MVSDYNYPDSKLINALMFKQSAQGSHRAYLRAAEGADTNKLKEIGSRLSDQGWQCIPFMLEGKPVLEVRGFKRDSELHTFLTSHNWVQGRSIETEDDKGAPGFLEKLKKRSLQASGLAYVAGDIGFFSYGFKGKRIEDMVAGLMYAAGTASLLGFGRNDQSDLQIKDFSKKIVRHLMKESVKLPDDCSLSAITRDQENGTLGKAHDFMRRYPSEMFNLFTGMAGAAITYSAFKHKVLVGPPAGADLKTIRAMRHSAWLDVGLGTMTMASTAIGGLVEERKKDPDAPPSHGVKAVMDWVHERPLVVSGVGLMVSTMFHAVSTYKDYHSAKKMGDLKALSAIPGRAAFVAANIAAELLIAISSKGHGEGVTSDNSVDNSVIALTAELIAKRPEAEQAQLAKMMADYLGRSDMLALKDKDVEAMMMAKVEEMRKNPWSCAVCAPKADEPAKPEEAAWQVKVKTPAASAQNALA